MCKLWIKTSERSISAVYLDSVSEAVKYIKDNIQSFLSLETFSNNKFIRTTSERNVSTLIEVRGVVYYPEVN